MFLHLSCQSAKSFLFLAWELHLSTWFCWIPIPAFFSFLVVLSCSPLQSNVLQVISVPPSKNESCYWSLLASLRNVPSTWPYRAELSTVDISALPISWAVEKLDYHKLASTCFPDNRFSSYILLKLRGLLLLLYYVWSHICTALWIFCACYSKFSSLSLSFSHLISRLINTHSWAVVTEDVLVNVYKKNKFSFCINKYKCMQIFFINKKLFL